MKVCGIDPGLQGAVAFIDGLDYSVFDMPLRKEIDGKSIVDCDAIFDMITRFKPDIIIYEEQGVKGDLTGRVSAMSMGRSYQSLLHGIGLYIEHCQPSVIRVRSQEWKKSLGVQKKKSDTEKSNKAKTVNFVKILFPKANLYGVKGGLKADRADALAIAEYGRRKYL